MSEERKKGKVKFFNDQRGFGFIQHEGDDYFVHISNVEDDSLLDGEQVTFKAVEGFKGLQAIEVRRVDPPSMVKDEGTVHSFNEERGFGFIKREGKADVFVHFSDVISEVDTLNSGDVVSFKVRKKYKGRDRAYEIQVLETEE